MGSFKRATTYSFGSISFGSLVVALINMLRQACTIARSQSAQDGNIIGTIFFCILGCLIGLLDWAVQFINRYAFSHIALYGKAYIPAAKDTWTMMKDRGLDALVNDCLTGPVLTMGSTFVGYVCALLSYLYLEFTNPAYNESRTFTPVIMAFSFLMGLQICQIFMTPIGSGIDTIFVAMGWDPDVAAREHPEFFGKLVHVYPRKLLFVPPRAPQADSYSSRCARRYPCLIISDLAILEHGLCVRCTRQHNMGVLLVRDWQNSEHFAQPPATLATILVFSWSLLIFLRFSLLYGAVAAPGAAMPFSCRSSYYCSAVLTAFYCRKTSV